MESDNGESNSNNEEQLKELNCPAAGAEDEDSIDETDCESDAEGDGDGESGSGSASGSGESDSETNLPESETEGVDNGDDGDNSDDSLGGILDKCPICLRVFREQEIGVPDDCEHSFCYQCILEWSEKFPTCPIDRKPFHSILVLNEVKGKLLRIQELNGRGSGEQAQGWDEYSDPTFCEICGNCDREDRLLLCDGCDLGHHLECLDPPLEYVPIEDWYCPNCTERQARQNGMDEPSSSRQRTRRPRTTTLRAPRTGLTRRIMYRRRAAEASSSPLKCSPQKSSTPRNTSRSSTSTGRPRKRRRTRKTKSRSTGTGGKRTRRRKTRRRKQKNPNRRRTAIQRKPTTPKGRLVKQLGILPPRPGQIYMGLPLYRPPTHSNSPTSTSFGSSSSIRAQRYQAGIAPLRIYGTEDLADCFVGSSDEEGSSTGPGPLGLVRPSRAHSTISISQTLKRSLSSVLTSSTTRARDIGPAQSASSANILGPILSLQYILHKDKNIQIQRDGTLIPSISISPENVWGSGDKDKDNDSSGYDSFGAKDSPQRPGTESHSSKLPIHTATGGGGANESSSTTSEQLGSSSSPTSTGANNNYTSASLERVRDVTDSGSVSGTAESSNINASSGNGKSDDNNVYYSYTKSGKNDKKGENDEHEEDSNIYSDIEVTDESGENRLNNNKLKPETDEANDEKNTNNLDDNESDSEMIIDESRIGSVPPGAVGSRGRSSRSSAESLTMPMRIVVPINCDPSMSPDGSSPPILHEGEPDSPLSIPLPDSTPPPSVNEILLPDDDDDLNSPRAGSESPNYDDDEDDDEHGVKEEKEEYDPSQPLNSSDDEDVHGEDPNSIVKPSSSSRKPGKGNSNGPFDIDLSSIPMPKDEYKRPTIQFSIPTRHRIFSMGSLIKRSKGVLKKELKPGSNISFQSEISKAFGGSSDKINSDKDEPEKPSLVSEIFGSDEEEEEEEPEDSGTELNIPLPPPPFQESECPRSENIISGSIQLPPQPIVPIVESTTDSLESTKWKKIISDPPPEDEVILVRQRSPSPEIIQIIETPPREPLTQPQKIETRPRVKPNVVKDLIVVDLSGDPIVHIRPKENHSKSSPKEVVVHQLSSRTRTSDSHSNSDTNETDNFIPNSSTPPRARTRSNERKFRKRRISNSSSTNCEEGEITDLPQKKRKRNKKVKKSKKDKKNRDSRSRTRTRTRSPSYSNNFTNDKKLLPEINTQNPISSSEPEDEGTNNTGGGGGSNRKIPSWKKPSKSSKDRNYRDGKPKPEEKYFREKEDKSPERFRTHKRESPSKRGSYSYKNSDKKEPQRERESLRPESRRSKQLSRSRSRGRSRSRKAFSRSLSPLFNSQSHLSVSPRSRPSHLDRRKPGHHSSQRSRSRRKSPSPLHSHPNSYRQRSPQLRQRSAGRNSRSLSRERLLTKHRSISKSRSISQSSRTKKKKKDKEKLFEVDESNSKKKNKKHGGRSKDKSESHNIKQTPKPPPEILPKEKPIEKETKRKRRKRREKSVSPAKEVFSEGDNILISLNFQKPKEHSSSSGAGLNGSNKKVSESGDGDHNERNKRKSSSKEPNKTPITSSAGSGDKPPKIKKTILIDLETSPIQEQSIGESPTLIVLSDDDGQNGFEGSGTNSTKSKTTKSSSRLEGVSTTTTTNGTKERLPHSPISHSHSHGVPADSTQLQNDSLLSSKSNESHFTSHSRLSLSPRDTNRNTPLRGGESVVTSTRDSLESIPQPPEDDYSSPFTPTKDSPTSATTPPLPPETPPTPPDQHKNELGSMNSSGTGGSRPIGAGTLPGIYGTPNIGLSSGSGNSIPAPLIIPTPPRLPTAPTVPNLLTPTFVQAMANALYQQQQRNVLRPPGTDGSGSLLSQSSTSRTGSSGGGGSSKKYSHSGTSTILLPKDQNTISHRRTEGGGSGDSPLSPNSSDGDDLFEPPLDSSQNTLKGTPSKAEKTERHVPTNSKDSPTKSGPKPTKSHLFDSIFGGPVRNTPPSNSGISHQQHKKADKVTNKIKVGRHHGRSNSQKGNKKEPVKLTEGELRLTEDVPTSAVELRVKEKFLKKLNRQERVIEEVKVSLKPHYIKKHITKDEYKEILRKAVPKICHNKTGEINPFKIKELIEAYVKKYRHRQKK